MVEERLPHISGVFRVSIVFFFFVGILLGFTANLLCNIPATGNSI